ncbi:hypothetical protein [Streptomyces sp. NPDC048737]|uniref:hypothetical protein n=1 Tax=unclassified Streptomyces TaxID=2593676 RepID=UPI00342D20CF
MEATESTGRDGGQGRPAGPDPLTHQLLRLMTAPRVRHAGHDAPGPGTESTYRGPDSIALMELVSALHRRGIEVGFPELTAIPACGRRRPPVSRARRMT